MARGVRPIPAAPGTLRDDVGLPLEPVYGPDDAELPGPVPLHPRPLRLDVPLPAVDDAPVRRLRDGGRDTNRRFKELLRAGGDGLSTAFDMPTLLGRDSDDPLPRGEVGRAGVAVDTLDDMETLFSGIDLGAVSTSMTINSPAATILAMYVKVADRTGVARVRPRRHAPERHLEGIPGPKGIRLPAAAVGAPRHRRHALLPRRSCRAGTRSRSRATTSARPARRPPRSWPSRWPTGLPTSRLRFGRGLAVDEFAPRLSFFFNAHIDFFEEIAKYRAARRIWARWIRERYGATDGPVLAAALPHPDRRRLAHCAAARGQPRPRGHRGAGRRARAARRACIPTRSTRRSPCRPNTRRASPCAHSR